MNCLLEWGMKPLYVREGGTIPVTPFLEKTLNAPALHLPIGQATDRAHLQNERLRLQNLLKGKNVLKAFFKQLAKRQNWIQQRRQNKINGSKSLLYCTKTNSGGWLKKEYNESTPSGDTFLHWAGERRQLSYYYVAVIDRRLDAVIEDATPVPLQYGHCSTLRTAMPVSLQTSQTESFLMPSHFQHCPTRQSTSP